MSVMAPSASPSAAEQDPPRTVLSPRHPRTRLEGGYIAMNARSLGATRVLACPRAEIAVRGPVAAVRVLRRRGLAEVDPEVRHQVETEVAAEREPLAGVVSEPLRSASWTRSSTPGVRARPSPLHWWPR